MCHEEINCTATQRIAAFYRLKRLTTQRPAPGAAGRGRGRGEAGCGVGGAGMWVQQSTVRPSTAVASRLCGLPHSGLIWIASCDSSNATTLTPTSRPCTRLVSCAGVCAFFRVCFRVCVRVFVSWLVRVCPVWVEIYLAGNRYRRVWHDASELLSRAGARVLVCVCVCVCVSVEINVTGPGLRYYQPHTDPTRACVCVSKC